MSRAAAGSIIDDSARVARPVDEVRPSFACAEWLAQAKAVV